MQSKHGNPLLDRKMTNWNLIDNVTMICLLSPGEMRNYWYSRHPNAGKFDYSYDPNLRQFWNSRLGTLIRVLSSFWWNVRYWHKIADTETDKLRWYLSWQRRGLITRFNTKYIAMYNKSRLYDNPLDVERVRVE